TGAIDLAWFHEGSGPAATARANGAAGLAAGGTAAAAGDAIDSLAQSIKFDQPRLLRDAIQRLYADAQVPLTPALVQFGSQEIDGTCENATIENRGTVAEIVEHRR